MVGVRSGEFKFPRPTHGPDSGACGEEHVTAEDALEDLPEQKVDEVPFGGTWGHLLPGIPPGLNYSFYTSKMGHPYPVFAWRSKFSDFLYKADPDRPVRTIKAQGGKYTGPLHWDNRHFTSDELKLLQSFPENFVLIGTDRVRRAVIGNSVPPALSRALAESVMVQIFNSENDRGLTWLSEGENLSFRSLKRQRTQYYIEKAVGWHDEFLSSRPPLSPDLCQRVRFQLERYVNAVEGDEFDWLVEIKQCDSVLFLGISNSGGMSEIETKIVLRHNEQWDIPYSSVEIVCYSDDENSLTACFKAAELVIRKRCHIDDLVQLNGYYQQPNQSLSINYENASENMDDLWKLASVFSETDLIGQIVAIGEWCELLSKEPEEVFELFNEMKLQGFDIRDRHTNPQIEPGHVLVTYAFPTLTTSKVQWNKRLGGMLETMRVDLVMDVD